MNGVFWVCFCCWHSPSTTWISGSFESIRWNVCVYRLDLGLYSHLTEFWGDGVRTHGNSKGKFPLLEAQRRVEPVMLHHAGQPAQHSTDWAIPVPLWLSMSTYSYTKSYITHANIPVCAFKHACAGILKHTRTHTRTCACAHSHTHTHTHTHTFAGTASHTNTISLSLSYSTDPCAQTLTSVQLSKPNFPPAFSSLLYIFSSYQLVFWISFLLTFFLKTASKLPPKFTICSTALQYMWCLILLHSF